MVFQENYQTADSLVLSTDYETERNKPMPSLNHAIVQLNLGAELRQRYKHQYRIASELSLELSNWPSVPDLAVYPQRPLDLKNDQIRMTEPPLCAVEIISPTQTLTDLTEKARDYFEHGVKSCWLVLLPLGNIYVYSSPDDYEIYRINQTLQDSVLGVSLPLKEVFE